MRPIPPDPDAQRYVLALRVEANRKDLVDLQSHLIEQFGYEGRKSHQSPSDRWIEALGEILDLRTVKR